MAKTPVEALLDSLAWEPIPEHPGCVETGGSLPVATHVSVLSIGGFPFRCYQLSNGERVFNADDVREFFGGEFIPGEGGGE